mgnify:CR=1 FL=1
MDEQQRAALLFSQSVCALLKGFGYISENIQRVLNRQSIAFGTEDFNSLLRQYGIEYNDALTLLQGR